MNVQIGRVEPQEFALCMNVSINFGRRKSIVRKTLPQAGSDGDRNVMLVVNRDSSQVFSIAEAFYQLLQSPPRSLLQYRYNALLQALRQDLGAPLQVLL